MTDPDNNSYIKNNKVQKYTNNEVTAHWILSILIFLVILTTLPLFRDYVFHVLAIYGGVLLPTPSIFMILHRIFAILLIVFALVQIFIISGFDKTNILMKNPFKDFKAYGHSVFYFIFLSSREKHGGAGMYYGGQRMVFMALVYAVGLLGISGVFLLAFPGNEGVAGIMGLTHVLITGLSVLVIMYHVGMNIRRHDLIGLRCYYSTGHLPLSYIKKHHKAWYREIASHERKLGELRKEKRLKQIKDPVVDAVRTFVEMEHGNMPLDHVEEIARKFKEDYDEEDLDYLVKVSKTVD